jgi:hypothetical protein
MLDEEGHYIEDRDYPADVAGVAGEFRGLLARFSAEGRRRKADGKRPRDWRALASKIRPLIDELEGKS